MPEISTTLIVVLAAIGVVVAAAFVHYQIVIMREKLERATSIMQDFKKLHPGVIQLLQQVEGVQHCCETQRNDVQFLSKHIDSQEVHISETDARVSEILDGLTHIVHEVGRKQPDDSALMRKGILSQDLELRFSLLKDWLSKNSLAILRRAAHRSPQLQSADELIDIIPRALEAEAELLDDHVLLVGTRSYPERYAIMLGDLDPAASARHSSNAVAS